MKISRRQLRMLLEQEVAKADAEPDAPDKPVVAQTNPAITKARKLLQQAGNAFGALNDEHSESIGNILLRLLDTDTEQVKELDNIGVTLEKLNPDD